MKKASIAAILVFGFVLFEATGASASEGVLLAQRAGRTPSGAELLKRSAGALAAASSYKADGSISVSSSSSAGKSSQEKTITLKSAYQKSSQTYVTTSISAPKPGTLEGYSDGSAVYLKATGSMQNENIPAGQWLKKGAGKGSLSGNPLTNLQLMSSMGTVTDQQDTTVDGKTYKVVQVTLTSELARSLMGMALAAAEQDIATSYDTEIKATSDAQVEIDYLIDPSTYISEIARFHGSEVVTTEKGSTTKTSIKGELRLSGLNQPVSMPDVSGAKTVETKR